MANRLSKNEVANFAGVIGSKLLNDHPAFNHDDDSDETKWLRLTIAKQMLDVVEAINWAADFNLAGPNDVIVPRRSILGRIAVFMYSVRQKQRPETDAPGRCP